MKAYKDNQTQTHVSLYQLVNNGKVIGICSHVWECWVLTVSQWSLCLKTPWTCMHVTPSLQISIHSQKITEKAKKKIKLCLPSFPR